MNKVIRITTLESDQTWEERVAAAEDRINSLVDTADYLAKCELEDKITSQHVMVTGLRDTVDALKAILALVRDG